MDRMHILLVGFPLFLFCSDLLNLFTPPLKPPSHLPHHQDHADVSRRQSTDLPATKRFLQQSSLIRGAGYGTTVDLKFCASCSYRRMGRRKKDGSKLKPGIFKDVTLREESSGMKDMDVSSILKIKHLQRLATWAGGEGGVPPLGALFGHKLAANAEALGISLDHSSFCCERCESILQPGFNCTIRIENYKNKRRQSKKLGIPCQNNVIYKCNFCYHHNVIMGTTKGHIKELKSARGSRSGHVSVSKLESSIDESIGGIVEGPIVEKVLTEERNPIISQLNFFSSPRNATSPDVSYLKTPVTPQSKSTSSSKKKKKMNELEPGKLQLGSNSAELSGSGNGTSKRKRKTWSSLKDIVERKEAERIQNFSELAIPFFMQVAK